TLRGIRPGSFVWCIEGQNWTKVRKVNDYDKPQKASFEPGEMKLYLVSSQDVTAEMTVTEVPLLPGFKQVLVSSKGAPFPVQVRVVGPGDRELYKVYRASGVKKPEPVFFPLPANAPAGKYRFIVTSFPGTTGLVTGTLETGITHNRAEPKLVTLDRPARTFDA